MKYYFVGIKGSGMAGLALIIKGLGHEVSGCDINKDLFTQRFLLENNIEIQDIENMDYSNSDIIVLGNAYLDKYTFNDKKVITYQELLSTIVDKYYSIAVCGTHGKTTTTNMIKQVLSDFYLTSYLVGDGQGYAHPLAEYFVFEACEHKEHFLSYHPDIVVCLNVDYDHVEYYKNKKQYKESFRKFLNQAKEKVIINSSLSYKRNQCVLFGLNNSSIKAKNVRYTEKGIYFNLYVNKEYLKDVFLPFYGKHMLMNSLACIACCSYLNLPIATIVESLKKYKDAGRRYNISFFNSNVIIDDYGHHPTEIKSTISAIKQEFNDKNIVVIYHPDRPKRLTTFLNDYKKAFNSVEKVYILPFISDSEEGKNAIDLIVDGNKINKFTDSFYKEYNNTVFLFTGSKEMGNIIKKLIIFL